MSINNTGEPKKGAVILPFRRKSENRNDGTTVAIHRDKLKNYTALPLVFELSDGSTWSLESSGVAECQLASTTVNLVDIDGSGAVLPINVTVYASVENLPDPEPGVLYIVTPEVARGVKDTLDRMDVITWDEIVEDEKGRIARIKSLMFP